MVQQLFNDLHQRVIKCLLVQLTCSATVLINVSLSIARLNISLKVPSHTSPIPLPPSSRCCIKTTIMHASVLIKCEWCHCSAIFPQNTLSPACPQTNWAQLFHFHSSPHSGWLHVTLWEPWFKWEQITNVNWPSLKRGAIQKQIGKDVC